MLLTDVLTACDLNPTYYKFIPSFIKVWNKLFKNINIHIILISDNIPNELSEYQKYIKLFKPISNIPTPFIAQNIRLLYPALIPSTGGILITDMDIIPMNTDYYNKPIQEYTNDKFICYRQLECVGKNEMVICYNIANSNIWASIFNIHNINDINNTLNFLYNNHLYIGHSNMPFWITDQLYLYQKVMEWNNITNNLIILNDNITQFNRLDRNFLNRIDVPEDIINSKNTNNFLTSFISNRIKSKIYTDYHMLRPYDKHKTTNDIIINFLCSLY